MQEPRLHWLERDTKSLAVEGSSPITMPESLS